jgi:hypothetical protein
MTQHGSRAASGYDPSPRWLLPQCRLPGGSRGRISALANHWRRAIITLVVSLTTACDINPYDHTQEPKVTITQAAVGPAVTIEWQPAGAQLIRVYRGSVAGDGYTDEVTPVLGPVTIGLPR